MCMDDALCKVCLSSKDWWGLQLKSLYVIWTCTLLVRYFGFEEKKNVSIFSWLNDESSDLLYAMNIIYDFVVGPVTSNAITYYWISCVHHPTSFSLCVPFIGITSGGIPFLIVRVCRPSVFCKPPSFLIRDKFSLNWTISCNICICALVVFRHRHVFTSSDKI